MAIRPHELTPSPTSICWMVINLCRPSASSISHAAPEGPLLQPFAAGRHTPVLCRPPAGAPNRNTSVPPPAEAPVLACFGRFPTNRTMPLSSCSWPDIVSISCCLGIFCYLNYRNRTMHKRLHMCDQRLECFIQATYLARLVMLLL